MRKRTQPQRSWADSDNQQENRISNAIFIFLIATLPFFTLRTNAISGSITHIAMILVFLYALVTLLVGKLNLRGLGKFELAHFLFLIIAAASVLSINNPNASQALIKSCLYFAFYISLAAMMADYSTARLRRLLIKASIIGVTSYSILFFVALVLSGVILSMFSTGLNFYSFTFRIYQEMFGILGLNFEITPREIRRNTIAGIFAFFFGIFLLAQTSWAGSRKRKLLDLNVILLGLCLMFIIALFSRRALIACVAMVIFVSLTNKVSRRRLFFILLAGAGMIVFAFAGLELENRFVGIESDTRFDQFTYALQAFGQNPFSGMGYAAKVLTGDRVTQELYVHNYVLSNMFMLGVPGLLFALYILWYMGSKAALAVRVQSHSIQMLLVIPFASMMVASAVEGIYVPLTWIIFAICFHRYIQKTPHGNAKMRTMRRRRQVRQ
ncbi:MAG: O-antigen ligase family protein [Granulosicoccus sp.]